MDSVTMKLSGNLGDRHRCFNTLVQEAYLQNMPLSLPNAEEAALDWLFKIDLASKQRNVDFIIRTLKYDDLLYVNRALKSRWLLEPQYSNKINPNFLEEELFPDMILPAVNKMRHWIQMHLRDPQRCKEFHQFYKGRDVDIAVKFLWHCPNEYVLGEIHDILEKITPKLLKRLSEKVPQITKIYYDSLMQNQNLIKYYLANDSTFFTNIIYLLKTDSNIFFHVLENFFDPQKFCSLSAVATKCIMTQHKCRFLCKPELYTAWFLDMDTLARHLSSEEIKDLILKLAKAEYLNSWLSYKTVEPLIKRINKEERAAFKILVFVDKAFGPTVKEWPYPVPAPPVFTVPQITLFDDLEMDEYQNYHDEYYQYHKMKDRPKTLLDDLFDKYRFYTYEQTFLELQKQIRAESSSENRMYMLLVLVSKTGGRVDNVVSLLDLLWQHRNEPVQIRAALFRSLVKRACVWRLPPEHWSKLLEWGHDLGLDGSTPKANCHEGLHAVLIRDLLAGVKPSEAVWKTFLSFFDTLHEYSFTADERSCVQARLPELLFSTFQSYPEYFKINLLKNLLDTLDAYHIKFEDFPGVVEAVVTFKCRHDLHSLIKILLTRLYNAGAARRRLIREYFEIKQTDESYVNVLRHDFSILNDIEYLKKLIVLKNLRHGKFFRKLALYFMEKDGLGERYYAVLANHAAATGGEGPLTRHGLMSSGWKKFKAQLAMSLAVLSGSKFISLLETLDKEVPKSSIRQNAAALRSHAHLVRPAFDLESFGWHRAGVKAVANLVTTCRQRDVERYYLECSTWRRSLRLALVLAKRVNKERDAFQVLASQRPGAALQAALRYFRRERDSSDLHIWEMVKSHILKANSRQCYFYIQFTYSVPAVIKAECCFLVHKVSKQYTAKSLLEILSVLPILHEKYVFDIIDGFLCEYFKDCVTIKEKIKPNPKSNFRFGSEFLAERNKECIILYIGIIARFLFLSKSEEMLEERYRKVALPFLDRLELFWKQFSPEDVPTEQFLDSFLYYLRYNKAYFDDKYVSCLPVIEKITEWMNGFLPMEKWFEKYVEVNLTRIFFKTIKHCLYHNSDLFSESRKPECSYMLGSVFGNFVSKDIEELIQKYFPSVTDIYIYGSEFMNYFNKYIYRKNDECFEKFTVAVVNALLTNKTKAAGVLAKYIFEQFEGLLKHEHVNDIIKQFHESGFQELLVEKQELFPVHLGAYYVVDDDRIRSVRRNKRRRRLPARGGKRPKRTHTYSYYSRSSENEHSDEY